MKRFKIYLDCDYVAGHLRYGHFEGVVEAENEEEVRKNIEEYVDELELIVDDYEIDDYSVDYNEAKIEEMDDEI